METRKSLFQSRELMAVREPFADFSPKKYKFRKLMFMQGWLFITCVNQGATANLRTWDNTKLKPVRIHRQRKAYVYISLYIYLSKCCIHSIYSPKMSQAWILWQFCKANCQAWIHKNTITYMSINSGIQTFREPFAALSRSFATAAKTHIHICRCHSDTKSLAWVLERLPHNMNKYIHT